MGKSQRQGSADGCLLRLSMPVYLPGKSGRRAHWLTARWPLTRGEQERVENPLSVALQQAGVALPLFLNICCFFFSFCWCLSWITCYWASWCWELFQILLAIWLSKRSVVPINNIRLYFYPSCSVPLYVIWLLHPVARELSSGWEGGGLNWHLLVSFMIESNLGYPQICFFHRV